MIIGICGPTCAGKTSVSHALRERIGTARSIRFPTDGYYRDLGHLSLEERAKQNFDHPQAMDSVLFIEQLQQLKKGNSIDSPVYDFSVHTRTAETQTIKPAPYVIAEGIFLLHWRQLRGLIDLSIFLDISVEEALRRRIDRDIRERDRTEESVRKQFSETVLPMWQKFITPVRAKADFIIDGNGTVDEIAQSIIEIVLKISG